MIFPSSKTCFKCGETKSLDEFYKHKAMSDGRLGKCKVCAKRDATATRSKNLERVRAHDRQRGNRQGYGYTLGYRRKNPEKHRAHYVVGSALRNGTLQKQPCQVCGTTGKLEAHHQDYSQPLMVQWLCSSHHSQLHRDLRVKEA